MTDFAEVKADIIIKGSDFSNLVQAMTADELRTKRDAIMRDYSPTVKSYTMDGETITLRSVEEYEEYIAHLNRLIKSLEGQGPLNVMKPRGNSAV